MTTALSTVETRQTPSLFPNDREWSMLKEQAGLAVKSGLLPAAINTPEKAIAIALKGRELGIPLMHSFSHIHIIQGKPCVSAELMLSLIFKNCAGAVVNYEETSGTSCVISAKRPGGKAARFSFTIKEADIAGLMNKDSWKKFPGAMLRARAISIMARALFPDAIMGCNHTPEELGAEVTDEGEIITLPTEPKKEAPKPVEQTPEPKPAAIISNPRVTLGAQIVVEAKKIGVEGEDLSNWAREITGCEPKNMTIEQMTGFLETIQYESGRAGA